MKYLWIVASAQRNFQHINEYTKFGLITFSRTVQIWFDLNNDFTTIDEYVDQTNYAFNFLEENNLYQADTNTATAMNELRSI